jgi:hypothetical protein
VDREVDMKRFHALVALALCAGTLAAASAARAGVITVGRDSAVALAAATACYERYTYSGAPLGIGCNSPSAATAGMLLLGAPFDGDASAFPSGAYGGVEARYSLTKTWGGAALTITTSVSLPPFLPLPEDPSCAPLANTCHLLSGQADASFDWLLEFTVSGTDVQIDRTVGARGSPPLPTLVDLTTGTTVIGEFAPLQDGHDYRLTARIAAGGTAPSFSGGNGMSLFVGFRNAGIRVPEPATGALMLAGLSVLFAARKKTRRTEPARLRERRSGISAGRPASPSD